MKWHIVIVLPNAETSIRKILKLTQQYHVLKTYNLCGTIKRKLRHTQIRHSTTKYRHVLISSIKEILIITPLQCPCHLLQCNAHQSNCHNSIDVLCSLFTSLPYNPLLQADLTCICPSSFANVGCNGPLPWLTWWGLGTGRVLLPSVPCMTVMCSAHMMRPRC